ncbi:protein of unknown function [Candidatus Nitrotoga arctica]|uniref:Uncharacterized protein n=1 Tax=Candidatus Nitrotoga arctica TaxID=453162 RepID=A0ABM8Z344_9PROT|nr:protein of unknown function [Candidatus Nitrotoga arctica]
MDVSTGQRRAHRPELMPGFTRIDSVHEGDGDGAKVLYYVNVPAFPWR